MAESTLDWRGELASLIPRLRRFSLALTRSPDLADDLLQSTLERALSKRHLFEPGSSLERWLFRICRNIWIDEVRKKKHMGDPVDPGVVEMTLAIDGEHEMVERMRLSEVGAEIARLSEDQRALILLVAVEGHSYGEASAILEIPIGTVMSRLARARRTLADRLYPDEKDPAARRSVARSSGETQ